MVADEIIQMMRKDVTYTLAIIRCNTQCNSTYRSVLKRQFKQYFSAHAVSYVFFNPAVQ